MFFEDDDFDIVDTLIEAVTAAVEEMPTAKKLTLDEFAEKASTELDKLIIDKIRQGNAFIAGRFKLVFVDDANFKFAFEIYFQPPRRNDYLCLKKESGSITMRRLQSEAFNELKQSGEIVYTINQPDLTSDTLEAR